MMHHVGKRKRTWQALLAALAAIAVLAACGDPDMSGGPVDAVESVTLTDGATIGMEINETRTLGVDVSVTGDASTDVTWTTSDEAVVAVDGGVVTAVTEGTANVTATSVGDTSISDTIRITVVAEPAVVINDGDFEIEVGQSSNALSVLVVGSGLGDDVTFTSEDETVASVDDSGVVLGVSEGSTTITATSVDAPELSDSVTVTVIAASDGGGNGSVSPEPRAEDPADVFDPGEPLDIAEADYTVTVNEDYDPYDLLDWEAEAPIPGTLREILAKAESGSVIAFDPSVEEVVLSGVDVHVAAGNLDAHLVFRNDVTLIAPADGVTIRVESSHEAGDPGDPFTYRSRVAYIPEGVNVTMQNLTLTGGSFIFDGAGIRNDGTLTLRNVTVTDNRAWYRGGGIYNSGALTIIDSIISDNVAAVEDDEVDFTYSIRGGSGTAALSDGGYGGGVANVTGGTVTSFDTMISGNQAKISGAGIYDVGGNFDLLSSTVQNNVANEGVADTDGVSDNTTTFSNFGGGVYTAGSLAASDTNFVGNETTESGGALYVNVAGATALWGSVLFDANESDFGGGIFHQHDGSARNLTPTDPESAAGITFTNNVATNPDNAAYFEQDMSSSTLRLGLSSEQQGPGTYIELHGNDGHAGDR